MPVSVLRCFGKRLGMRRKEMERERRQGEGRRKRGEGAREEEREDRMGAWERRWEGRELQRTILKILS